MRDTRFTTEFYMQKNKNVNANLEFAAQACFFNAVTL